MQGLLDVFWLFVWDYCLVEIFIFSPESFPCPVRFNSSWICFGISCFFQWCVIPQYHFQPRIIMRHLCTSYRDDPEKDTSLHRFFLIYIQRWAELYSFVLCLARVYFSKWVLMCINADAIHFIAYSFLYDCCSCCVQVILQVFSVTTGFSLSLVWASIVVSRDN